MRGRCLGLFWQSHTQLGLPLRRLPARHLLSLHGLPGDEAEAVELTGEIKHYESSPDTFRGFCPSCGTRLYFRSDRWPDEIHVHAATMTNPDDYQPDAQVLMRSRLKWLDRLPSIAVHDGFQQTPADRSGA